MYKIDSFACDIMNCFTNHVRKNVTYTEVEEALIKICFRYSAQIPSEIVKKINHRHYEKVNSRSNVFLEEGIN